MNKDQSTYQYIVNYLQGRLSSDERIRFENRLTDDPAFALYVANHKIANEVIMQNEMSIIKTRLQKIHEVESGKGGASWKWLSLFIGAVVLLSVGGWYINAAKEKLKEKSQTNYHITNALEHNEVELSNKVINDPSEASIVDSTDIAVKKVAIVSRDKRDGQPDHTEDGTNEKVIPNLSDAKKIQSVDIPTSGISSLPNKLSTKGHEALRQDVDSVKDCDGYVIGFKIKTTATCVGRNDGMAEVIMDNNEGYRFSIDRQSSQISNLFKALKTGIYSFSIVDSRGCYSDPVQAEIGALECDFVIQPSREIYWDINLSSFIEDQVLLQIYDGESGAIIYQEILENSIQHEWSGINSSGQSLPMGNYVYVLSSDSKNVQGSVTIAR